MKNAARFTFMLMCTAGLHGCNSDLKTDSPNIILIQVDDLGWDDLAVHGNQWIQTPAIDRLAKEGLQFQNFYVNSVCAPTRASLLTGRHFLRTGVSHVHGGKDFIHPDEVLLSESLKANGYRTGMWGKWHSGKTTGYFPWERGFDEAYMAQLYKHENSNGLLNGQPVEHKKWASEVITDYALEFIKKEDDRPFFAYLSYLTVHAPLKAPEHLIGKYRQKGLTEAMATLYGMIDQMDSCIHVLINELEKSDFADNTMIFFISDNGPAYNGGILSDSDRRLRNHSGYKGHKGNLWENGVKSPLFVRWPAKIKPGIDRRLTGVTDLYPTIVELAGGKYSERQLPLDGQSIAGYFNNSSATGDKMVFDYVHLGWANHDRLYTPEGILGEYNPADKTEFPVSEQLISLRQGNYKLMKNPYPVKGTDFKDYGYILINIKDDPREEHNLMHEEPEKFEEMSPLLNRWMNEILGEEHSFSAPEFLVTGPDSEVLGYAASTISEQLTNTGFYLAGWQNKNQSAVYKLNVKEEGDYRLDVHFSELAVPFKLQAKCGSDEIYSRIEKPGITEAGILHLAEGGNLLVLSNQIPGVDGGDGQTRLTSLTLRKVNVGNKDQ